MRTARRVPWDPIQPENTLISLPTVVLFMKQIFLAIILIAVPVVGFAGFQVYATTAVKSDTAASLGDLSSLKTIIAEVQASVDKGDLAGAAKRITDFESAWDLGQTSIRPLNPTYWGNIDAASDAALSAIRQATPSPEKVKATLATLMTALNDPSKPVS